MDQSGVGRERGRGEGEGLMIGVLGRIHQEPRDQKSDRVGRAGLVAVHKNKQQRIRL